MGLVFVLIHVGPEYYETYAELRCDSATIPVEVMPDMNSCVEQSRFRGCACQRPVSVLAQYFYNVFIPLMFAVVAMIALRGSLRSQSLQYLAAVLVGACFTIGYEAASGAYVDPVAAEGTFFWLLYVLQVSGIGFLGFFGVRVGWNWFNARRAKAAT